MCRAASERGTTRGVSAASIRPMASRATLRCARRAAIRVLWRGHHGRGRYAEAPLPPAPVRPRGRGALAYCFSHPVPHQRDGIGREGRGLCGTTEGDKPHGTRLPGTERESAGRGGAHLKTGGAHRAPSFSTPADGAAVAADDASRSAVLREDAPRPSARNVPPASSSSEPMSTALESGVSAAVASRRGGW